MRVGAHRVGALDPGFSPVPLERAKRLPVTSETQKARKRGPFGEAAEGTRTLDLLHGKWLGGVGRWPELPANRHKIGLRYVSPGPLSGTEIRRISR